MYLWAIHFSFIGDESIYFPQELFATMELKLFWEGTALGSKIYGAYHFLLMILFFKLLHHGLCAFFEAALPKVSIGFNVVLIQFFSDFDSRKSCINRDTVCNRSEKLDHGLVSIFQVHRKEGT